jgi:hypothetical protein
MQNISPPPELDPQTGRQPVASRYTDYDIPAHGFLPYPFQFVIH